MDFHSSLKCLLSAFCFIVVFTRHCEGSAENLKIKAITQPNALSEGPFWDGKSQSLYFVDIYGQNIWRLNPKTRDRAYANFSHGPVGVVVPVRGRNDQLIVGSGKDILLVTWNGKTNVTNPPFQKLASLDTPESDTRVNDGKCDPSGRFWIGTMGNERNGVIKPNLGSLYRFNKKKVLTKVLSPVSVSNGLAWNKANNIMYYVDSPTKVVVAFNYSIRSGNIHNKRVVFDFLQHNISGVPDGMTIDKDDNLWVAANGAGSVIHINPKTKELLGIVKFPADKISSLTFGGPELDVLYVTSAYDGLTESQREEKPDSGSVFEVKGLGVKGTPVQEYLMAK